MAERTGRWFRRRWAPIVYADIFLLVLLMRFRYRTGMAIWWIGLRWQRYISADWAHDCAIPLIRWTFWQPSTAWELAHKDFMKMKETSDTSDLTAQGGAIP